VEFASSFAQDVAVMGRSAAPWRAIMPSQRAIPRQCRRAPRGRALSVSSAMRMRAICAASSSDVVDTTVPR